MELDPKTSPRKKRRLISTISLTEPIFEIPHKIFESSPSTELDLPKATEHREDNKSLTKTRPRHKRDEEVNHSTIGKAFVPIIVALKSMGCTALHISQNGKEYKHAVKVTYLWNAFCIIFITTFLSVYILNSFGIPWPVLLFSPFSESQISPVNGTSTYVEASGFFRNVFFALRFILPITSMFSGILGLHNSYKFAVFLNRWTDFSILLHETFSPYYKPNFSRVIRLRNMYLKWFCAPMVLFPLTVTPFLLNQDTELINTVAGTNFRRNLNIAYITFMVSSVIFLRVFSNLKDFLSLIALAVAYEELTHGVKAKYSSLKDKMHRSEIQKWVKLVMFIRNQRELLQSHIGPQNLWLLVEIFSLVLLVLTAVLLAILHELHQYTVAVVRFIMVAVFIILFLFWKAHLAETITEEEERFVEAIVAMTGTNSCEMRLEMKSLCDLIFHDPIKISFGNMVVLTKSLILAFCSQLAATLVIVLQFVSK